MRAGPIVLALVCAAAPAAASPAPIVGGHDATSGEWPDAAAVMVGGVATCTGVLVAPDVVVTAGHCCGDPGSTLDPPPDHVIVGALSISDPSDGETIAVAQAIAHPDHVNDLDVGVLVLATPSTRTPRVLATGWAAAEAHDGATATIAGWGATSAGATTGSDLLQEATVTIVQGSCTDTAEGCRPALMPGGELTAGGGGTDTCGGDSGGPLYVAPAYGTFLAATTYGGYTTPGATCGDGGIYERADRSIDWIEATTGRVLARVAGPIAPAIDVAAGATATSTIAPDDPLASQGARTYTFEVAVPPADGAASVDDRGVVTYTAPSGGGVADTIVVRVHDAAAPARAAAVTIDVSVGPGGCDAGGSSGRAWLPLAIAACGLRRRRRRRASGRDQ